jgi:hypothetical protein
MAEAPKPCEGITGEHVMRTTDVIRNGTLTAEQLEFFENDVDADDILPCLNRLVAGMAATPAVHVGTCFYRAMFLYVVSRGATNRALLDNFGEVDGSMPARPLDSSTQTTSVIREYVKAIDRLNDAIIALHPGESSGAVFDRGLYPEMVEAVEAMSAGGGTA